MPKSKQVLSDSEDEEGTSSPPKGKKAKQSEEKSGGDSKFDSEGRLELSKNRFVSVRDFKV